MNRKKEIRCYNALFPTYLLWLVPVIWIIVIPANFIIDSAVLLITLSALKIPKKSIYKKTILKIWGIGFLSDLIGSVFLFSISQGSYTIAEYSDLFSEAFRKSIGNFGAAIGYNPFINVCSLFVTIIGIAISSLCIYHFNLKYTFKKTDLTLPQKKRIALMLAIFTAPYMLLIPVYLFY